MAATSDYDVVVVGGGINGVGIAQAAAARGHTVLLLEKDTLAAGTSSRSSKLIHGGLRYLESGELGMVRESLRERALLLRLAPELVKLERFYLPVYPSTRRRPWQLRVGLTLYALLANFQPAARFRTVRRAQWEQLDGLKTEGLQSVLCYHDAQTDDARLTEAVMSSARTLGAELAMPARFTGASLEDTGCAVEYEHEGRDHGCTARVLVNAAGPWVSGVNEHIRPRPAGLAIELVQGTHIIVPGRLEQGIYYVESPRDGRAVFVMPWRGNTLVGTTEKRFRGDPDEVRPLASERHYLTSVLQYYFPRYREASRRRIVDAFAGLRVLPGGRGHVFHRSRETILRVDREHRPRVLTVYGGKLTSYRSTAEKVVQRVAASLPSRKPIADTRRLPLRPIG